jgi:membrane protein
VAIPTVSLEHLPRPFAFFAALYRRAASNRVVGRAAEVAFFTLLSLPPTFLAVLGGMGYVAKALGPETTRSVEARIFDFAGIFLSRKTVRDILRPAVTSLLSEGRADIIGVGLLIALWSASRATKLLMEAVRVAHSQPETRKAIQRRLIAIAVTIVGIISAIVLVPLLVAGPRLGAAIAGPFGLTRFFRAAWQLLYWPVAAILGAVLLAAFYAVTVPTRSAWSRYVPGAAAAVGLWLLAGVALRLYASGILQSDTPYGPLAAPFVLLLWLYVTSLAVILGAELNAATRRLWPAGETAHADSRSEIGHFSP